MALLVERPMAVDAFLARAGAFLEAHEAEHNLLFAICSGLTAHPEVYAEPPRFAIVIDGPDRVAGVAIQTPPRPLVLSRAADPGVAEVLATTFAWTDLPGVLGPPDAAARFADRWVRARPGRSSRRKMRERIYRLTDVKAPRPASGRARVAGAADHGLLVDWLRAFSEEALGESLPDAPTLVDRWLARLGDREMWLWETDGQPVSLAGVNGPTPHGIRIGPVYTPPSQRGRGYAGNLVAAASQAQLDAGRSFVFLFTDLANPTSNHVYQAIGYQPVGDVDQWAFDNTIAT